MHAHQLISHTLPVYYRHTHAHLHTSADTTHTLPVYCKHIHPHLITHIVEPIYCIHQLIAHAETLSLCAHTSLKHTHTHCSQFITHTNTLKPIYCTCACTRARTCTRTHAHTHIGASLLHARTQTHTPYSTYSDTILLVFLLVLLFYTHQLLA